MHLNAHKEDLAHMSATLYYFTGTGNSLFIAKTIAKELSDVSLIGINQMDLANEIYSDSDMIGIIYPIYFLDIPEPVQHFISNLIIREDAYLFLYANYGEHLGNGLYNPYIALKKRGFKIDASFGVALPDNSIIFPTDIENQVHMLKISNEIINQHAKRIANRETTSSPKINYTYHVISPMMKLVNHLFLGMNKITIDTEKCSNCNICTTVCSSYNMLKGTTKPTIGRHCSMCFSCIHYCPKEEIHFKNMKSKSNYQYRNPDITIKEIIDSRIPLSD
jgi:NAD-dependent dihydropyrimidine dehydrogenase PreA subunit/flavodoxin